MREQTDAFFAAARAAGAPLWRLSVKARAPYTDLGGEQLIEWSGALRWLAADERADPAKVRALAQDHGGHATLFRAADKTAGAFHPLPETLHALHRRLKAVFDPAGILNRGRLSTLKITSPAADSACRPRSPISSATRPRAATPTRSCARACTAASARRPARRICSWATSRTGRAGASISSRRCSRARGHGEDAAASRPLPHVPELRDHVSVRRPVRAAGRHRPARGRPARAAAGRRARRALADPRGISRAPALRVRPGGRPHAEAGAAGEAGREDPRRAPGGRVAGREASAENAGARRLRAGRARARHRRRARPRARPDRDLAAARSGRGLLRRACPIT